MPNPNTYPEGALRKLGQRLRQGWAKQHPTTDKTIETIKETVRQEWEQQRNATRSHSTIARFIEPMLCLLLGFACWHWLSVALALWLIFAGLALRFVEQWV